MLAIFLLVLHMNLIASEEEYRQLAKEEIAPIHFSFMHSHQLSPVAGIGEILDPYVTDACNYIPTMNYMTKNNSTTTTLQAALFGYYVEYQNHLLQPIRNPYNLAYRLKCWKNCRKTEKNLREQIGNYHKHVMTKKSLNEECDINIAMIQKITKELVLIEKANKKGDH